MYRLNDLRLLLKIANGMTIWSAYAWALSEQCISLINDIVEM